MKRTIIIVIVILFLVAIAGAITDTGSFGSYVQNQWNTSNGVEDVYFNSTNSTLWVELPKFSQVSSIELELNTTDNLQNLSIEVGTPDGYHDWNAINPYLDDCNDASVNSSLWSTTGTVTEAGGYLYARSQASSGTDTDNFYGNETNFPDFRTYNISSSFNVNYSYEYSQSGSAGTKAGNYKLYIGSTEVYEIDSSSGYGGDSSSGNIQAVFDKDNLEVDIYVDGVFDSTTDISGEANWYPKFVTFASDTSPGWTRVDGKIDYFYTRQPNYDFDGASFNGTDTVSLLTDGINAYLDSCTADGNGNCTVPFFLLAYSEGNVTFDISQTLNYSLDYNFTYDNETIEQNLNYFNITVPSGNITSATLYYNNTAYAATLSSETSAYTSLSPEEVSSGLNYTAPMYWELNVSGDFDNTTEHNQTVHQIYFYNCTSSPSLTFNLVNEDSGDNISGDFTGTFYLWYLEGFNRSFYFDLTGNNTYQFCKSPAWVNYTSDAEIQYTASGYFTRSYFFDDDLITADNQEITLYLLNESSDTTIFTVYDFDATSTTLSDAYVRMERYLNGSWVQVDTKYTDISGKVQFGYVPLTQYRFTFSKDGYNNNTFELNPILFDTYDIKMSRSVLLNYSQDFEGLSITYDPSYFYNDDLTLFTFNIYAPGGSLSSYGYNLTFPGGTESESGSTATGGQLFSSVNVTGADYGDVVTFTYYYQTALSGLREYTITIPIHFNNTNVTTFVSNRDETYGMGIFERVLIMTIMMIFIVGIASLIGQPIPGLALGLVVFGYVVYIGFIPLWSILPSMLVGVLYLVWKSGG